MSKTSAVLVLLVLLAGLAATTCMHAAPKTQPSEPSHSSGKSAAPAPSATSTASHGGNVLLAEWSGPYGGVPPLASVKIADLQPALETSDRKSVV